MSQSHHAHLVDRSPARRAHFSAEVIARGLHAEIYDSVEELCGMSAIRGVAHLRQGAVLLSDDEAIDVGAAVQSLRDADCHLPVIAFSNQSPCSSRIVAAIWGGALDYLCFPEDLRLLRDRIADAITRSGQLARRYERRARALNRIGLLTDREREVLHSTIEGATSKETAAQLGLSHRTVEVHRAAILQKLGVATSAAAIAVGIAAGMLELGPGFDSSLARAA